MGADRPVPNLEGVVKSAALADRPVQTKQPSKTAPAEVTRDDAPDFSDKSYKAFKTNAESPDQNAELGQDVPTIEEVLTGGTWEDRLAKARIRRENIIAQRNTSHTPRPEPTSARQKSKYKDTIRVAISGATPVQPSEKPQADLKSPVLVTASPTPRARRLRPAQIAAGFVLLLGLGLVIAAKTTDRTTHLPTDTTLKTPDTTAIPIPAKITESTIPTPDFNPGTGLAQSVPTAGQTLRVALDDMPGVPSQFTIPSGRSVSLVALSTPGFDNLPFVSKAPIKAAKPAQTTSLGMRRNSTFTTASALASSANLRDRGLQTIAPVSTANIGDASNPQDQIGPLAMFAAMSKLAPSDMGQAERQTILSAVAPHVAVTRNGSTFLQPPADPDLVVSAPAPATSFKVASNAPTFPLFRDATSTRIELAPLLPGDLRISRTPTALPIHLPQGAPPVASQPPAAIVTPEKTQQQLVGRNYQIRLSAPTSLSDSRLDAYTEALGETGLVVGQANRVTFRVSANHVRYFHPDDREAARQLAISISGDLRDFTNFSPSPELGTIEIWLAGNNAPSRSARSQRPAPSTGNPALKTLRNRLLESLRRGEHL